MTGITAIAAALMTPACSPADTVGQPDGGEPLGDVEQQGEMPAARPVVRRTFVAPMLPLPATRTSVPVFSFTSRYPNGMAPSRYASRQYQEIMHSSRAGTSESLVYTEPPRPRAAVVQAEAVCRGIAEVQRRAARRWLRRSGCRAPAP